MSLNHYLEARGKLVDAELHKILRREADVQLSGLLKSMQYTLMAKGKRLRPILAIMVYELFGSNLREIAEPACAVELIHAASLMIDDLPAMDNAKYRRGKRANHLVYSESTTILASAALWVAAFKIFSGVKSISINALVKETADSIGHMGIIRGQFMDVNSFKKVRTLKELDACYYLKTGLLFENAAKIGALIGKATPSEFKALAKFGRDFGLAFQINDDIVDAESTFKESGKDVGIDTKNLKPNYVSILGLEGSKQALNKKVDSIISDLRKIKLQTSWLEELANMLRRRV